MTIRNTRTLVKRNAAPCMVQYKLTEGGIVADTANKRSPFRLRARISSSQPETKYYIPDEDGDAGHPCGAHWTMRTNGLTAQKTHSERRRPSKLTFHMKRRSICQAKQRAKLLTQEITTKTTTQWAVAAGMIARPRSTAAAKSKCRMWMVDGGSSVHLLRRSDLSENGKCQCRSCTQPNAIEHS